MRKIGNNSIIFDNVYIREKYSICGKLEYEGPYGSFFDKHFDDNYFGEKSFEKCEMKMLSLCIDNCILKLKGLVKEPPTMDLMILGDLNNQIAISNYVMKKYQVPFLGIYSACATFTESLILGSVFIDNKFGNNIMCGSCSHNSTSERQFRNPNEYGGQKPDYFTFTTTSAGTCILSTIGMVKITSCTIGKVIDFYQSDANDLPRTMAPACADTILEHLKDLNASINEYDLVVTGDLSKNGSKILKEILFEHGVDIYDKHFDCGEQIYDIENQPVYAGGSGAGCIAGMVNAYIIEKLTKCEYKKIMIIGTGALLNPVMCSQKESIPSISHLVVLERLK